jgi:predicted esterase
VHCAGWFDLYRVEDLLQAEVDHEGVNASVRYLDSLVEAEAKEVPASRIVVGGFSQVSSVTSHQLRTQPHLSHQLTPEDSRAQTKATDPTNRSMQSSVFRR